MMPIENIQEIRSVCAWNILFARSLHAGLQSGRTKEPLAVPGARFSKVPIICRRESRIRRANGPRKLSPFTLKIEVSIVLPLT